ncbi:MAG: HAMP domain-containing sensor histidine kinase [Myxococcota bacterium]
MGPYGENRAPEADRNVDLDSRAERRRSRRKKRRELTTEERAYRDAQRAADRKIRLVRHLFIYCLVCAGILVTAGFRVMLMVAFFWGIGLVSQFFSAIVAPNLRREWIQSEVERKVQKTVSRERRALEGQHVRSLEELAASIAHEIRNPVTAAKSLVQQLVEDPNSPDNVEYSRVALEELDRVERSIAHLLRYARDEELRMRDIRIADVVDGALDSLRDRLRKSGAELRRRVHAEGELEGDPEKLRRVVVNLVGNALDSLEESATPEPYVEVETGENLAGTEVWCRIRDNGPGIPPEMQERVFRPFFTSKENGTGLGLPITRKVVEAHGGTIEFTSVPGEGVEFVVSLPKEHSTESQAV